jgi:FAD:protein FMN transferase
MYRNQAALAPNRPAGAGRRRFALATALGGCIAAWPLAGLARSEPGRLRESRALMGTRVDIAAQSADALLLRPAFDAAYARMAQLTAVMSHYAPTSSVSAIGLAAGLQPVPVPRELMQVLQMARAVSQRSGGAFDITIGSVGRWHFGSQDPQMPSPAYISSHLPVVDYRNLVLDTRAGTAQLTRRGMRIDPGGIAKLYILAAGIETLREHGLETALVNGGGDVVAMSGAGARPWRIGIRDPRQPEKLLGAIDVRRGFVASSGDYERFFMRDGRRYHHVLDPKTGYPAQGPHGVTLVGDELESVNGLGAAAMVLDTTAGRELIRGTRGVEGLIAGRDDSLWITPALRERLV